MTTYTAEQIIRIGGREWRKGNKHRVYINRDVWTRLIGLETSHYKTGNIRSATLDGEQISNSRAYDILHCIDSVYWDSTDGQIHIRIAWPGRYSDRVPDWIRDGIAEAVAALDADEEQSDSDDDTPAAAVTPAAEQVAALRAAGRTVREIAEMVGCAVSTIYRWLRGVHRPSARYAARLTTIAA